MLGDYLKMTSSDIVFFDEMGRDGRDWIASATRTTPEVVNINRHPFWINGEESDVRRKLLRILSHETLHHVLWATEFRAGYEYDKARSLFLDIMPDDDDCYTYL